MDKEKRMRKAALRVGIAAAALLMAVGYLPFGRPFWHAAAKTLGLVRRIF